MTDQPVDKDRKFNLWTTVKGPFKAHGDFDKEAISRSGQLYLITHPMLSWMIKILVIAGILFLIIR